MILVFQAQCLHTVTEDNASAAQLLCGSSDLMKVLEKSLMADGTTSDMLMLKVLTAGIWTFPFLCQGNKFNTISALVDKKNNMSTNTTPTVQLRQSLSQSLANTLFQ